MSSSLVIGCPVRRREWVAHEYIGHIAVACREVGITPDFVFVIPKGDPTRLVLRDAICSFALGSVEFIETEEEPAEMGHRNWSEPRVRLLVDLRNKLLRRVRQIAPPAFLSLDSDLLLAPDALGIALHALRSYDAVGMRCYMSPASLGGPRGTFPGSEGISYAQIVNDRLTGRYDVQHGLQKVDVVLAAVLMSSKGYQVDYQFHRTGEDAGWSKACAAAGVTLGFAAEARAKHILEPGDLDKVDPRVGF